MTEDFARARIERLGHAGDGVATGPIYIPRTLPGELVEGEPLGDRIEGPRILEPSRDRVAPPCPHYRRCGGCALQHASEEFVEQWKADLVCRALAARGIDAEVGTVVTSPPQSRRRATLAGRRTKGGALVGFHGRASHAVTAISDCRLLHPDLMAVLPALERIVELGGSRKGEVALAIARTSGGVDVSVMDAKPVDARTAEILADVAAQHGLARLVWNGELVAALAPPAQIFGRARVVPPSSGFLQATEEGEAALVRHVRGAVYGDSRVVDLFSGAGTFSLPLAERAEVHAVESDAKALAALDAGWRSTAGLRRVTTEVRDLFRRPLLPDELQRFDAVVIDPPRAGAEAQTSALAEGGPPTIAFVSCNPATFARDAKTLVSGGYDIGPVTVVDQFRWSVHVELATTFTRRA